MDTPFESAWWSFGLFDHRPCNGTYCRFDYDSLPPIDMSQFDGSFRWLPNLEGRLDAVMAVHRPSEEERAGLTPKLDHLVAEANALGFKLPDSFINFMNSTHAQDQIPSCTACYFDLPETIIKSPFEDGGYFIPFLIDQQSVLTWALYLKGEAYCVVVSLYGLSYEMPETWDEYQGTIFTCGKTFEPFIYRFWLENVIWFGEEEGGKLLPEQQAYLDHYAHIP